MNKDLGKIAFVSFGVSSDTRSLHASLQTLGYNVRHLECLHWLEHAVNSKGQPLVLLLGHDRNIKSKLCRALASRKDCPVLAVFTSDEGNWQESFISNFDDFVGWPCHQNELALRLSKICCAISSGHKEKESVPTNFALMQEFLKMEIVGQSPSFVHALGLIKRFAHCDVPVFIEGETGTGKELASRAIHNLSDRSSHPFIAVNCGAIPDSLLENEFFGHEKGAYTDATKSQDGLVAQANCGTLFLDEVDTLSPKGQVTLLRFIEDQEYRPLGSECARKSNVRLVSGSNSCLSDLCRRKHFRRDLMYRLKVLSIKLPPLRERPEDVALLARHFIRRFSHTFNSPVKTIPRASQLWLDSQRWEGNVRELENLLQRAYVLADGPEICLPGGETADDTIKPVDPHREYCWSEATFQEAKAETLDMFEKKYLEWLMGETTGNISLAAKRSGKQRSAIRKMLQKHRIDKNFWIARSSKKSIGNARAGHLPAGSSAS